MLNCPEQTNPMMNQKVIVLTCDGIWRWTFPATSLEAAKKCAAASRDAAPRCEWRLFWTTVEAAELKQTIAEDLASDFDFCN